MNIQVSEWGWEFVLECFRRFQGEGVFYLGFIGSLIWLIITGREDRWKRPVMAYFGCLALLIFNPLLVTPVIGALGLDDEYYRLIWLLPFTIFIAWFAVDLIGRCKRWWKRMLLTLFMIIALAIPGKSILARGLSGMENIYKVPDELIVLCDIIHEDSDKEEPKAALDFDLVVLMGQYDPSIRMTLTYSDCSYMESQMNSDYNSWFPPNMLSQMHIYQALYQQVEVVGQEVQGALEYTETEYVVVKKSFPNLNYLYTQGLYILDETESYVILKLMKDY